jgi:hypothetical protein
MAKFSQLFYTVLPAFPCHLPIFMALMIAINQLFSSNSTSSPEAKARRQFERERAIDHELRRSRHVVEVLGVTGINVTNRLNGGIVRNCIYLRILEFIQGPLQNREGMEMAEWIIEDSMMIMEMMAFEVDVEEVEAGEKVGIMEEVNAQETYPELEVEV